MIARRPPRTVGAIHESPEKSRLVREGRPLPYTGWVVP